jgi:two-component sensor histidine kinase
MPIHARSKGRWLLALIQAWLRRPPKSLSFRLAFMFAGLALSFVGRLLLEPVVGWKGTPFITFWAMIVIITFVSGPLIGLVAVAISAVVCWYLFVSPFGFDFSGPAIIQTLGFTLASSINVLFIHLLRQIGEDQQVLIRELNHRARNLFSVIQAVASRSLPAEGRKEFLERLYAMAKADQLISNASMPSIPLRNVVGETLAMFKDRAIAVSLPEHLEISGRSALYFSLLLHELSTNAAKYGALRSDRPDGTIEIRVALADRQLCLSWEERGVGAIPEFERSGFGFDLMNQIARILNGKTAIARHGDGIRYEIAIPDSFLKEK